VAHDPPAASAKSRSSSGRTSAGGGSTASRPAALGLAGGGDGERLTGEAAAVKRPLTLALPKAEGALGPSRVITPDGTGAALSASTRSHSAKRFVALASVRLAQMPQAGSPPESAASAWVLPRQATHRRWRSPLTRTCPQSGYCLDIINLKVEESINTQAHYLARTRC